VHVLSVWCPCDVPVVCLWCPCGAPVVCLWCAGFQDGTTVDQFLSSSKLTDFFHVLTTSVDKNGTVRQQGIKLQSLTVTHHGCWRGHAHIHCL